MRDAASTRTWLKNLADAVKTTTLLTLGPVTAWGQLWPRVTGGILGCPYGVPFVLCPVCPIPCTINIVRPWLFGVIMASSILFGRVFCGLVCPLGVLSEFMYKLPVKKIRLNNIDDRMVYLKMAALSLFVYLLCEAALIMVGLWSDGGLWLFLFQHRKWVTTVSAAAITTILIYSAFIKRPWCRYLCPLGTALSIFNRFSIFSMERDSEDCEGCDSCKEACFLGEAHWDSTDCIRCFSCYSSCSRGALRLQVKERTMEV